MFLFLCCKVNIAHKPNSHTVVNKGQKVLWSFPQLLKILLLQFSPRHTKNLSAVEKIGWSVLVYSWKPMEEGNLFPENLAERNELGYYLNCLACNINTPGLASSVPSGCVTFLKKIIWDFFFFQNPSQLVALWQRMIY